MGALTRLAHAAVTGMLARGYGGILNVSSMASLTASPGSAVYGATKAFVTSLTESLHAELAGTDVHVTALLPGFTQTEFHAANDVEVSYLPKLAWLDPDTVAQARPGRGGRGPPAGRPRRPVQARRRHRPPATPQPPPRPGPPLPPRLTPPPREDPSCGSVLSRIR